jgi:acyl carrier protein
LLIVVTILGGKMDKRQIEQDTIEIIAASLKADAKTISKDSKFSDDLGIDSLELVELIMKLEEKFKVTIPDADANKLQTINDIVEYIAKEQKQSSLQR